MCPQAHFISEASSCLETLHLPLGQTSFTFIPAPKGLYYTYDTAPLFIAKTLMYL